MKESAAESPPAPQSADDQNGGEEASWGKWLFRISIVASLIFIWWLVIYDHGVVTHH